MTYLLIALLAGKLTWTHYTDLQAVCAQQKEKGGTVLGIIGRCESGRESCAQEPWSLSIQPNCGFGVRCVAAVAPSTVTEIKCKLTSPAPVWVEAP